MVRNTLSNIIVLMVNYNSSSDLRDCLRTLADEPIDRIVVVDNSSAAADFAALELIAATHSNVEIQRSDRNLGFAGGMNLAFAVARPRPEDIIWLVNPDTSVAPGCAEALARALRDDSADIVSPVITTGHGESSAIWYGGGGVRVKQGESYHLATRPQAQPNQTAVATGFVTGAALMTSANTWSALGGLREDLFLYWEDTDLSLQAIEAGYRLAVVPDAEVWHLVGGSSSREGKSAVYYYYMARNRLIVSGERTPRIGVLVGSGLRSTIRLVARASREPNGRFPKVRAVVMGSIAGLVRPAKKGARAPRRWGRSVTG